MFPRTEGKLRRRRAQQEQPHPQEHAQAPLERWEQFPIGIQLMNEIADAISIGSDFAFWGKSAVIFYSPALSSFFWTMTNCLQPAS